MFSQIRLLIVLAMVLSSCNTGNLRVIADLPRTLSEASGLEKVKNSDYLWMINDSGNKPILFGLDTLGNIKKELKIKAKNHDWEELTSDNTGNIYIGDFGNNANKRKNLKILKVMNDSLFASGKIDVEKISFSYPEQKKFPPDKDNLFFDCEAFFHYNDSLFLFTKSRTKTDYGKTDLYKIPATKGHHKAEFIASFNTCDHFGCWVTSADINVDENKIALLTENAVLVITDFKSSDFFTGTIARYPFTYNSQKESVIFKNDSTLYITDERSHGAGGNLYEFSID